MNLLFDNNISYRIIKKLSDIYINCLHVSKTSLVKPAKDIEIWNYAKQNNFCVVTFDEDFEQLEMLYSFPPKIILLKFGNASTQFIADYFLSNYTLVQDFIASEKQGLLELY